MLVGLVKTIFYILIFYYLFKFIGRYIMPFFLKKGIEHIQKKQEDAVNAYKETARQKEGSVTVQQTKHNSKDSTLQDNQGEYVDFEEVK